MSRTKFAFLPPNSAGATIHIFSFSSMLNTFSYLVFTLTTPFPLQLHIRKQAAGPPNCQTQLLGYWCQFMTGFETIQEEETKILSPLFFITNSWLQVLALYKPLDFSWGGEGHRFWGMSLLCSPLHWLRIKTSFLSPPNSVFFILLQGAEKAKILVGNSSTSSYLAFPGAL